MAGSFVVSVVDVKCNEDSVVVDCTDLLIMKTFQSLDLKIVKKVFYIFC